MFEKSRCFKATIIAPAVLAMFKIYFLAFVSLISCNLTVVVKNCAAFNLVFDCVVSSAQTLGDQDYFETIETIAFGLWLVWYRL